MARIMFDSDVIADLPRNSLAATYSDLIPNKARLTKLRAEFPHGLVLIDRGLGNPTGQASVADVETGALTVADFPDWYDDKTGAGIQFVTAYVNRSTLPALDAVLGNRHPYRWVATLDGTMHIAGFRPGHNPAAVQFASEQMLGFHADGSVVWQDGWHPEPSAGR
jgi:hypothetical protein